ncbi:hypothetical protein [Labrys wisconsinensis]|uniref:Phenylacetate-CoA ligase n=1 Tax=Labrys wisconsinensis TaxID=425677 RepID=A0ABU0J672_9HYPH|nr:hypothetical protein [Labrys wisconsinensis]MDQ0469766.1 phenylacetate-CoA ligase [Labrys wisconsinensis]
MTDTRKAVFPLRALPAELVFEQLTQAFAASQHFSRQEIRKRQAALLERVVRHAHVHVPFYRDSRRLAPLFRANGSFDLAGWNDVPVLTRNEAHEHEGALQATSVPPDMGALQAHATSGSTGTPLKFRQTFVQQLASEVLLNRTLRWHGLWPISRIAVVAGGAEPTSPWPGMLKLPGPADFARHVDLLREHQTTHAIVAPSIAVAWADHAREDLPHLTTIMATGEVLRPEMRRTIEHRLKVKVINLYSASELGPIASEGADGRLRLSEETLFVEGPPGAHDPKIPERLVVTPFYAFGTPLVRYAPGDYVRFSNVASKNTLGLRGLDDVIGRQRNLFRRPDGSLFLPGRFVARGLQEIIACREWQLVQTSLTHVDLKIAVLRPPSRQQLDALEKYLKDCLPSHETSVIVVDAIENDMKNGKSYELFLSLVGEGR